MADESSVSLHLLPTPANTYNPICTAAQIPGSPVAASTGTAGEVVAAVANSSTTTFAVGLVGTHGAAAGARALVQFAGPLTLTTAEWDALVTGQSGGLTKGLRYYLSGTANKLTVTSPVASGTFGLGIGIALSETTLMIQIYPTIAAHA